MSLLLPPFSACQVFLALPPSPPWEIMQIGAGREPPPPLSCVLCCTEPPSASLLGFPRVGRGGRGRELDRQATRFGICEEERRGQEFKTAFAGFSSLGSFRNSLLFPHIHTLEHFLPEKRGREVPGRRTISQSPSPPSPRHNSFSPHISHLFPQESAKSSSAAARTHLLFSPVNSPSLSPTPTPLPPFSNCGERRITSPFSPAERKQTHGFPGKEEVGTRTIVSF